MYFFRIFKMQSSFNTMQRYFQIQGYFADDHSVFDAIISSSHDYEESTDDIIFFYGLTEPNILQAIQEEIAVNGEFFITAYQETELV